MKSYPIDRSFQTTSESLAIPSNYLELLQDRYSALSSLDRPQQNAQPNAVNLRTIRSFV